MSWLLVVRLDVRLDAAAIVGSGESARLVVCGGQDSKLGSGAAAIASAPKPHTQSVRYTPPVRL